MFRQNAMNESSFDSKENDSVLSYINSRPHITEIAQTQNVGEFVEVYLKSLPGEHPQVHLEQLVRQGKLKNLNMMRKLQGKLSRA